MNRSVWAVVGAIVIVLIAGMVFGASPTAAVLTPPAVIVAIWQIFEFRRQAGAKFEAGFAVEYRNMIAALPAEALLGRKISKEDHAKARSLFFRYFDLCNQQAFMYEKGRITDETWADWLEGIGDNMRLTAFARAWSEIKAARPDCFPELRRLEIDGFVVVREPVTTLPFPSESVSEEVREAA